MQQKQTQTQTQSQIQQQAEANQILSELIKDKDNELKSRAFGCIAGAFIGDSLGSYCEFRNKISQNLLDQAMNQPGGGTFCINKGQLTDDSEMALSLAYGLIEGKDTVDLNLIAKHYGIWIQSGPFDRGQTISNSLKSLRNKIKINKSFSAEKMKIDFAAAKTMKYNSQQNNQNSQSNGSLMRITPLALYCLNLSQDDIIKVVSEEIQLTHSNQTVIQAGVVWVIALVNIINTGSASQSYQIIKDFIMNHPFVGEELRQNWFVEFVEAEKVVPANTCIGWAKIAWANGLQYLKQWDKLCQVNNNNLDKIYYSVVREVIGQAGDTDTNACIIGGMIGALVGIQQIPQMYLGNLLNCDVTKNVFKKQHFQRPQIYNPYNAIIVCDKLLKLAPKILKIND